MNTETWKSTFAVQIWEMKGGLVKDLDRCICSPTWSLKAAIDLLTTFRLEQLFVDESERLANIEVTWKYIHELVTLTLSSYEFESRTFLCEVSAEECPDGSVAADCHETTVYPDSFIDWAKSMSIYVPDDFYKKLMLAQQRHRMGLNKKSGTATDALSAKEKRELGLLRREKENFDSCIKATVRAVQYCIKAERRVKRAELFDLLCDGEEGITKEAFERILPLLPPEYRKGPGAPSSDKLE